MDQNRTKNILKKALEKVNQTNCEKNISIIIPLKDRSEFTLRILYYLSNINFAFKIFICDGSL